MNEALNALQGEEFDIRVGTSRRRATELLELLLEERRRLRQQ
jgi:hypothetical protein